jgi:AcrR family transcriptional regulator
MASTDFQRARQAHQKAHRREDILRGAREMLDAGELDRLTHNELCRRVGIGKSTLYSYFDSLDDVLLEVLHQEVREWADDIAAGLEEAPANIPQLASVLARATASRPRLCELSTVAGLILRRAPGKKALSHHDHNQAEVTRVVGAMAGGAPALTAEQHAELLRMFFALILGLWPDARPWATSDGECVVTPSHGVDFEASLERGASLLAHGLAANT